MVVYALPKAGIGVVDESSVGSARARPSKRDTYLPDVRNDAVLLGVDRNALTRNHSKVPTSVIVEMIGIFEVIGAAVVDSGVD